jgi:hypothetical protein
MHTIYKTKPDLVLYIYTHTIIYSVYVYIYIYIYIYNTKIRFGFVHHLRLKKANIHNKV